MTALSFEPEISHVTSKQDGRFAIKANTAKFVLFEKKNYFSL